MAAAAGSPSRGAASATVSVTYERECREILETVYEGLDGGFETLESLKRMGPTAGTYGEITYAGVAKLLQNLEKLSRERDSQDERIISSADVFYDLGCGVGKLLMQVMLTTFVRRVVGIEWGEARHRKSVEARQRLAEQFFGTSNQEDATTLADRMELRCEDVAKTDVSDATLVFFCCVVFEEEVVHRVAQRLLEGATKLRYLMLTQKLAIEGLRAPQPFAQERRFALVDRWCLPMSWTSENGGNMVYVYRPKLERAVV
ncbi:unnamed protein product [Amoebophrya sp. A25]|nr:unnamed protein product [Amoebophrya sp. A25]|eukprot:GSA25T00009947001.1